jgi:hypothetical protein
MKIEVRGQNDWKSLEWKRKAKYITVSLVNVGLTLGEGARVKIGGKVLGFGFEVDVRWV